MPAIKSGTAQKRNRNLDTTDPVLLMVGVGKQLWKEESGDRFIERLRSEFPDDRPLGGRETRNQDVAGTVWRRIKSQQGKQFQTARGLPFTYKVEGTGIWFFREGRRINRKLARTQVDQAILRCPLRSTTEIKDLMDYAYLFALLMDRRIRAEAW